MAFYYVKAGGTATGDAGRSTTARVGSFATMGVSAYYNSVRDVFAGAIPTTPPDGDNVLVSNLHSEVSGATYQVGIGSVTTGLNTTVMSTDDSNVSLYLKGAEIRTTNGDIQLGSRVDNSNNFIIKGFVLQSDDVFDVFARYSNVLIFDCSVTNINGNALLTSTYQNNLTYLKCVFDIASYFNYGYKVRLIGCSGAIKKGDRYFTSGAAGIYAEACDFSASTVPHMTSEQGVAEFHGCKLTPAMMDLSIPSSKRGGNAILNSCYATALGGYYYQAYVDSSIKVSTSILTYLNYKYDSVNGASLLLESQAGVGVSAPGIFKLCDIPAQDLAAGDKTYRVQLLLDTDTVAALTDSNFWIDLVHSNNTDLALGNIVSSRNTDILSAGVTLTASTETWLGTLPTNTQAYQVDIALLAAGLTNVDNSNVVIYVNLAVPNADVYVDQAVQVGP